MKQFIHALIAASLFLGSTLAVVAQSELTSNEQENEPIYWPKEARPKLSTTSFYTNFDGIAVPMYRMQSDALSFELANRKTLRVRPPSSNRYSGELTDSRIPGVSLGVSVFKKGEFLPDLTEKTWSAYKAGLLIDKPNIDVVLENTNIGQAMTPYIFGEKFRQIVYERKTSRGTIKRREIFAIVGPNLLVFSVNGTKETVEQNWTSIEQLIGEMSRN